MSDPYSPRYQPVETRHKRSLNCYFYMNGDEKSDASKVCLSNRIRTLDGMMEELTRVLPRNNRPGGVRNIFTPRGGHPVRDLSQFIDGECYVAALGSDRFKPITYSDIRTKPRHRSNKGESKREEIRPVVHARDEHLRNKSGRARYLNEHCRGLRLRVHSQKRSNPCQPVAVPHFQTRNFDKIREIISEAVGINEKSLLIYKFTYGGEGCQLVNRAEELQTDDAILAIYKHNYRGKPFTPKDLEIEKYQPGGYANFTTQISASPRKDDQTSPRPYRHKKSLNKWKDPLPSIGSSSKQSGPISPYSNPPSQGGRTQHSNRSRPSRQVDYDADQSGIYRAKGQDNSRGAKQVNETHDTRTERPIDQMEAEEVAEEKINEDMREGQQHNPWDDPYEQTERSNNPRNSTPASAREARQRDEQKQVQAATKLQAGARGWKARRDFKAKKQQQENNRRQEEEMRRQEDEMRKRDEDSKRQDLAATKIQAGFKGYKVRKARRDKLQGQK